MFSSQVDFQLVRAHSFTGNMSMNHSIMVEIKTFYIFAIPIYAKERFLKFI